MKRLGCAAMAMALFLSLGGHLALLQGVAWATMVRDFSRSSSLTRAVANTLDGRHPCALCTKISKARNFEAAGEKAPVTLKVDKKSEAFVKSLGAELPMPLSRPFSYGPEPCLLMPERFPAPPVPVPRAA